MKYYIILIFSILSFYSCEKTIRIDIEDKGRKIVVNGIFEADSTLKIHLSESQYILSGNTQYVAVNDATVSLFENGIKTQILEKGYNGIYEFTPIIKQATDYKIVVNSSKFGESLATSHVPESTDIDGIEYEINYTSDQWSQFIDGVDFKLRFQDKEAEPNFYLVQVYSTYSSTSYNYETGEETMIQYKEYIPLISNEPSLIHTNYEINGLLFDDELFDGDMRTIGFSTDYFSYGKSGDPNNNKVPYYVVLHSLSKELYNYYLSYTKYSETEGDPFAEPVKVFNNIENGFGIFGGSSASVDSVLIDYPLIK